MRKGTKPRSLMLIHNFSPGPVGGAELQAERLACSLAQLGHPMQVMTNPISEAQQWYDFGENIVFAPAEEIRNSVHIHRVPFAMAYQFTQGYLDTFRYLAKNRNSYDILHCHMAYGHAVVATIVARIYGKRCLIKFACTGEIGELGVIKKFKGYSKALHVLHQADAVIAISHEMVDELLAHGFSRQRIIYIPNGVDTTSFQPRSQAVQREKLRFILVGRRTHQKGVDLLLRAVRNLKSLGLEHKFEVQLYGSDYPDYDYRGMASELGVDECVSFLPFHKEMASVYQQADGFLLPSRGEGLSNSLLEAMATGLPVIASRVSGTPDVVTDGQDGLLIPPESSEALANAMKQLIANSSLCQHLGQNARRRIEEAFSLEHVANQYSALYSRLSHLKG